MGKYSEISAKSAHTAVCARDNFLFFLYFFISVCFFLVKCD